MWKEGKHLELIICIALGLLVGVLSSLSGLGGGFLLVPLLIYLGKKAQMAVGTSLMVVLLIAISSLIAHSRLGNVDYKMGLTLAIGGVVGAQIGPLILKQITEQQFKMGFAVLLVGLGVWLMVTTLRGTAS